MQIISYSESVLSILPPLLALLAALVTRKVILSLGLGVLLGSVLLSDFSLVNTASYIGTALLNLVYEDGLNAWNLEIIFFLLLLGGMSSLMTQSGATQAFAQRAKARLRSRRQATMLTALLSFVVFIDDYFHSLAVGSVTRPVTDQFKVSRAKLAYLLDSTAAPICVLMPLSSWGAYIIALIGGLLVTHGVTGIAPLTAFVSMIPYNFYALFALVLALIVAYFNINFGPMAKHERRAMQGELYDPAQGEPAGSQDEVSEGVNGSPWGLIAPLVILTLVTMVSFIVTGAMALSSDGQAFSILGALENTSVSRSLVVGAVAGLVSAWAFALAAGLKVASQASSLRLGLASMLPAIFILLSAWTISGVISDLETGRYLSSLVSGAINPALLPLVVFVLASIMAFSTGTSWGTFGIMLPIAADMSMASEPSLLLPMLSAVLAGAVFGDHASPISDTSILSSTGAGSHHMDHVNTQLPYALLAGAVSIVGYLALGLGAPLMLSLALCALILLASIALLKARNA